MPTDQMWYHSVNKDNLNRIDKRKFFNCNTQAIKLWKKEKTIFTATQVLLVF